MSTQGLLQSLKESILSRRRHCQRGDLQFCIFEFGGFEDRDIRVGICPECRK
jgi:hypothetical protein